MARDVATESTCIGCKETKPADQFTRHPRMASGLRSRCRACTSVQARQWQSSNAAEVLRRHLEKHYGITLEQYEELFRLQGGRCAICNDPPATGLSGRGKANRLVVDHDHDTGAVRGLLCRPCNSGVGHLRDSGALLRKAIAYLEGGQ